MLAQASLRSAVGCSACFITLQGIHFPVLSGRGSDGCFFTSTEHNDRIGRALGEELWYLFICLYLFICHASSSHSCQTPFQHLLPFYQRVPHFALGPFSAAYLPVGWCSREKTKRTVQRIKMTAVITSADQLQPAWAPCSIWHFFTRKKTFTLGEERGEQKISSCSQILRQSMDSEIL